MAKRPSFLAKLEQELPEAAESATAPAARAGTPLTKPDVLKTTLYVPYAVHERLREIAFTERVKVHDLYMEGIDRVLDNRGHPERTTDKKTS